MGGTKVAAERWMRGSQGTGVQALFFKVMN